MADNNVIQLLRFPAKGTRAKTHQNGGEVTYILKDRAIHPLAHEVREVIVGWVQGRPLRRAEVVFIDRVVYPYYFVSRADHSGLCQHTRRGIAAFQRGDGGPWFLGAFEEWMRKDLGYRARKRLVPIWHDTVQHKGGIPWEDVGVLIRISTHIISLLVLPEEVRDLPRFTERD